MIRPYLDAQENLLRSFKTDTKKYQFYNNLCAFTKS